MTFENLIKLLEVLQRFTPEQLDIYLNWATETIREHKADFLEALREGRCKSDE